MKKANKGKAAASQQPALFPDTFTTRVLAVVAQIPKGTVLTYRQVAAKAGSPHAYRAVGNVLNSNYNPKIPCHRVVRSDGKIGGYNRGSEQKQKMLFEEGVKLT